jgi:hypothetical protein
MRIGHICLAGEGDPDIERFARLIEAISRHAVEQHVLVASHGLAQRLAKCAGVTVGPTVRSPLMAYCLMPNVDVAHVHDGKSGQAGLLLTLTRSIPFVMTANDSAAADRSPLAVSVLNRAAYTVQSTDNVEPAGQEARRYLGIYAETVSARLEFPEKSDCRH